ncbi:TVP38/TMEM64 family protein, partial [Corynebacterium sp. MC-09]|nr:TVP38/TMEM64 family protein [Corynebacterium parakroppenstedtii]
MTTVLSWARSFGHFLMSLGRSAWRSILQWSIRRWMAVFAAIVTGVALLYFFDLPDVSQLREASIR